MIMIERAKSPSFAGSLITVAVGLPKLHGKEGFTPQQADRFAEAAVDTLTRLPQFVARGFLEYYLTRANFSKDLPRNNRAAVLEPISFFHERASTQTLIPLVKVKALINQGRVKGYLSPEDRRKRQEERLGIKIPKVLTLDVTKACNIKPPCKGCYAEKYGKEQDPSFDDLEKVVEEAKYLGISNIIWLGGEPLLRKKDILKIQKAHPELSYHIGTNGVLLDKRTIQEFLDTNAPITFLLHLQGLKDSTERDMAPGIFDQSMSAMKALREMGAPFGFSTVVTSENFDNVTSPFYTDFLQQQGCVFGTYFPYTGDNKKLELTREQRNNLKSITQDIRRKGMFVMSPEEMMLDEGGCMAGTGYVAINGNGDLQACVFSHYSDVNIYRDSISLQRALATSRVIQGCQEANKTIRPCLVRDRTGTHEDIMAKAGAYSTEK